MSLAANDVATVRAGFIIQGTTFKAWCRDHGIDPSYAHAVVAGRTNGRNALALRARILAASSRQAA